MKYQLKGHSTQSHVVKHNMRGWMLITVIYEQLREVEINIMGQEPKQCCAGIPARSLGILEKRLRQVNRTKN